jgi:hypothetical protein
MAINYGLNEPIQGFFLDFPGVYEYNYFACKFKVLSTKEE